MSARAGVRWDDMPDLESLCQWARAKRLQLRSLLFAEEPDVGEIVLQAYALGMLHGQIADGPVGPPQWRNRGIARDPASAGAEAQREIERLIREFEASKGKGPHG